jgi:hypothetical protein
MTLSTAIFSGNGSRSAKGAASALARNDDPIEPQ